MIMINNARHRIAARLGRRGAMLTALGLTYALVGVGAIVLVQPPDRTQLLYFAVDPSIRAVGWWLSGVVACIAAWRPRGHSDLYGWYALWIMPLVRMASYFAVGAAGDGLPAVYQGLLNVSFCAVALICSGWKENPRP